jgi:hypothetical protein
MSPLPQRGIHALIKAVPWFQNKYDSYLALGCYAQAGEVAGDQYGLKLFTYEGGQHESRYL